jgi:DNA-directed RNA polymerase specialized sigma24 family protein
MGRRAIIIRALTVLVLVWIGVWGIRAWASSRRVTAEMLQRTVAKAKFDDWSKLEGESDPAEASRREKEIRDIAGLVNRLDFRERQKNRQEHSNEVFFSKLNQRERELFFDLTIRETMDTFMEALDQMSPDQRKKFVEQGLKEIESGRTAAEMKRARELGDDLLGKASEQGMRAYFEKANADTKLDLAPLLEAMNETMQGLRGAEFGGRR